SRPAARTRTGSPRNSWPAIPSGSAPTSTKSGLKASTRSCATPWSRTGGRSQNPDGELVLAALRGDNVVVMVQPPRGFGVNPIAIYHDPDLPPSHHYLAAYHWLRDRFGAHAVV